MEKFKVNDRVRRLPFTITLPREGTTSVSALDDEAETTTISIRGCLGVIKALCQETTITSKENKARAMMIQVLWDNGTLSYHGPEAIEVS